MVPTLDELYPIAWARRSPTLDRVPEVAAAVKGPFKPWQARDGRSYGLVTVDNQKLEFVFQVAHGAFLQRVPALSASMTPFRQKQQPMQQLQPSPSLSC